MISQTFLPLCAEGLIPVNHSNSVSLGMTSNFIRYPITDLFMVFHSFLAVFLIFFLPSRLVNFFLPSKSLQPLLYRLALVCENKDSLVTLGEPPPLLTKSSFVFDPEHHELWSGRSHRLSILCQTSPFQIGAVWVIFSVAVMKL